MNSLHAYVSKLADISSVSTRLNFLLLMLILLFCAEILKTSNSSEAVTSGDGTAREGNTSRIIELI